MTDRELQDLVASLAEDTKRMKAEAERRSEEADKRARKTDRQIRELGKQIGGLGNKFGSFTEGIVMPSVQQLLFDRFGVEDFMPRRRKRFGSKSIEIDALGIVNGSRNEAYIVEIKSHLRQDSVEKMLRLLEEFRSIFPEYADKKLYGILAATDANGEALEAAQKAGLYVVTFNEDLVRFQDDTNFTAKAYWKQMPFKIVILACSFVSRDIVNLFE